MIVAFAAAAVVAAQSGMASKAASPPPIAVVNSPPPPIIAVPTAPMPPIIRMSDPSFPKVANVTVRIRALAGRTVLLDDRFRVGRSWASFTQNRSEAAEQSCPQDYGGQSVRATFSMTLRPQGMSAGKYHLSTSWSRPTGSCDDQGSRSVSVDRAVSLKPGETVVVEGDGGLRVEITQL